MDVTLGIYEEKAKGFQSTGQELIWATTRQNVSSGVSDQDRHKPACAATDAS